MSLFDPDRRAALDRDPAKDRVKRDALAEWQRSQEESARQYAHRMRCLNRVAEAFADDPDRQAILHAAGVARMGQQATATQLETARRLHHNFPRALALLEQGRMFVRTVEIVLQATKHASDAVQAEVGRRLLEDIAQWDAADVSRRVAAVLPQVESELEGQAQRWRHERARANRGMWVKPVPDGMARVGCEVDQLSAGLFAAGLDEIDRAQAELDRRDGVVRSAGQRRADLFIELPARYLALCEALQQGTGDALVAEAGRRNQEAAAQRAACALGDARPVQDELALHLPAAGPPGAWQLDPAELAVQLLRVPVSSRVRLNVHVPMTTLLELDQRAARLDVAGHSYLPAFQARGLLPRAELRRVIVDADSGIPLAADQLILPAPEQRVQINTFGQLHERRCGCRHDPGCPETDTPVPGRPRARGITPEQRAQRELDKVLREQRRRLFMLASAYVSVDVAEPRHDPSPSLRALVQLRDQTDRGIGSSRPARSGDLDHRQDWAKGGPTAVWNLDAEGKRAHRSKDDGWVPEREETTGVMTWTSPLGLQFRRLPVWDPPPPIPDDAQIPPVDASPPLTAARDRAEHPDRPLWRDPRHPYPPRASSQDVQDPPPKPTTKVTWPFDADNPPF